MWFSIFGMACITFLNRYAFLTNSFNYVPNEKITRLLSYSSYSVLTAIWTPIVFQVDNNWAITVAGTDYLLGCSLAALMSLYRMPSLLTVILSAVVFFGIRFLT
jgi:branched-subunit amino acid transport protein